MGLWPLPAHKLDFVKPYVNNARNELEKGANTYALGAANLPTKVEFTGCNAVIELYVFDDGKCPAEQYLLSLDRQSRQKVDTLFELMGQQGQIRNKQHFKKLEGTNGIFEFKRHQIRLLCFSAGGNPQRWVLTHGITKQQDKHAKADIKRAEEIKQIYSKKG